MPETDVMPWEMAAQPAPPQMVHGDVMPWEMAGQQTQDNTPSWLKSFQSPALQIFTQSLENTFQQPVERAVNNTLESLKSAADQTGQAISEPLNNPRANGAMAIPDAIVRTIGKAGNALGGAYGALLSPLIGTTSAAIEPLEKPAGELVKSLANDPRFQGTITPDVAHNLAMQQGGDLTNAVMLGKAGVQGAENAAVRAGLAPSAKPYDPIAAMQNASGSNGPRAGLLASMSSDPNATLSPPAPKTYSVEDMDAAANKYYDQADAAKAVIGAPRIQNTIADIKTTLANNNFDPDFHPQTAKWLAKLEDKATDAQGNPVDMQWSTVNGMRKLLNGVINDSMKQGGTEDGYQAIQARNALVQATGGITPSDLTGGDVAAIDLTQKGNTLYSAARKAEDVQDILDKGANAEVPATVYKNGFGKLALKLKDNSAGWTPEEIEAANYAAKTGIVTRALKLAGSRLGPIAAGAAGLATGGPVGAAAAAGSDYAISGAARAAASALQRSRGTAVRDMFSQRPAVQAAMQALQPPAAVSPVAAASSAVIPALPLAGGALAQAQQRLQQTPASQPPVPQQQMPASVIAPSQPQASASPLTQSFASAESGNNPTAKNPKSTASGSMQFTDPTWAYLVKKYGKDAGITLADKDNPQAQATMASLYAKENIPTLQKALGRAPGIGDLYAAHFLGASGAAKLIRAQGTNEPAFLVLPKAANANPRVFFDGNRARTVEQVYQLLNNKVSG